MPSGSWGKESKISISISIRIRKAKASSAVKPGRLFVICGPSGVGKTTIVKALLAQLAKVAYSVSYTTRRKRPGEVEGKDYHFVSPERFAELIKVGEFLEYAQVHGHWYGTSAHQVREKLKAGKDVILSIDVQGARRLRKLKKVFGYSPLFIFILPPSREELKRRIERRGTEGKQQEELRMRTAVAELKEGAKFDCLVVNNDLNQAIAQVKTIILASREDQNKLKP